MSKAIFDIELEIDGRNYRLVVDTIKYTIEEMLMRVNIPCTVTIMEIDE